MAGRMGLSLGNAGRFLRNRKAHRGQIIILALIFILFFLLVAVALIDVYHVQEARVWGYRVAHQAAIFGASGTLGENSNWKIYQTPTPGPLEDTPTPRSDGCNDPILIELDANRSMAQARQMLIMEMDARGFVENVDYIYDIRVIPTHNGDTIALYPTAGRMGGSSDWSTENPAVGVYLEFYVATFLGSLIDPDPSWSTVTIRVFAAAEVRQPERCPV